MILFPNRTRTRQQLLLLNFRQIRAIDLMLHAKNRPRQLQHWSDDAVGASDLRRRRHLCLINSYRC
jgi:hypothetical protein